MKKLITMLSALTITSSIAPLTVACGKNEVKGEIIELSKITPDMLTDNIKIDETSKNNDIVNKIENNVNELFTKKLTGLEQKKYKKLFYQMEV